MRVEGMREGHSLLCGEGCREGRRRVLRLALRRLPQEAGLMATLRHPNIVLFLGVSCSPPAVVTGALRLRVACAGRRRGRLGASGGGSVWRGGAERPFCLCWRHRGPLHHKTLVTRGTHTCALYRHLPHSRTAPYRTHQHTNRVLLQGVAAGCAAGSTRLGPGSHHAALGAAPQHGE